MPCREAFRGGGEEGEGVGASKAESGREKAGEEEVTMHLPKGWRLGRVEDFFTLQRGYDITSSQLVKGLVPVVYSNGIRNFHNEAKAKGPGVITGRSGTIGSVTFVETNYWPHNTALWVTNFKGNFPKFIYYSLQFLKLDRFDAGSGVPTLNRNDIHKQQILMPPLKEQIQIAAIFSTWDVAIEKTEKLFVAKKIRHSGLSNKLLSRKANTVSLKKFLKLILRNVVKPDQPYFALGIRSHGKGTFRRFVEDPNTVAMDTLYKVKHDDLIVNITFAWEGAIAFVEHANEDCLVSHRFPTFEVDISKALPDYLRHVIVQKRFIRNLGLISPGGAGRNRVLNKTDFLKLNISLPGIGEQEKIGNILNTSLKEISLIETSLELLKKQKRGLMQKLLTGKWRVKTAEEVS